MDKANLIKALTQCGKGGGMTVCAECPYVGMDDCDQKMCADAAAMLKANEPTKAKSYSQAYIFTKRTDMKKYCTEKVLSHCATMEARRRMIDSYAKEKDVQLIAMFRWENGKCFCKVKCPINPFPIKGEFETPGTTEPVLDYLVEYGWLFQQRIYPRMFQ